jgi:hypothetical protein
LPERTHHKRRGIKENFDAATFSLSETTMKILTDLEAEHCGGGLGSITVSPTVTVNTGLFNLVQLNTSANTATSLGGNAGIGLLQGNGVDFTSYLS